MTHRRPGPQPAAGPPLVCRLSLWFTCSMTTMSQTLETLSRAHALMTHPDHTTYDMLLVQPGTDRVILDDTNLDAGGLVVMLRHLLSDPDVGTVSYWLVPAADIVDADEEATIQSRSWVLVTVAEGAVAYLHLTVTRTTATIE